MSQTKEEKAARRKARREKRKAAKASLPPQSADSSGEEESGSHRPANARRPYSGFKGIFFEQYTDFDNNPDCFRIYSDAFNLLGLLKLDHRDRKWSIDGTRYPENWDFSGKFDTIDGALQVLYNHYLPMVTRDLGSNGAFRPWFEPIPA